MKKLILYTCTILLSMPVMAQTAKWQWAKTDTNGKIVINPSYAKQIVAATANNVLWGVEQSKKMVYGSNSLGDYKLSVYDTNGVLQTSTNITGSLTLIDAQPDGAGNWYILGQFYDTVRFPGGTTFTRDPFAFPASSEYFIFRISNNLTFAWAQHIGNTDDNIVNCFTVTSDAIYMPVDSVGLATRIRKFHLSNGAFADIITQTGQSTSSSIAVDNQGNIYLAGSCAFTALNFNGHLGTSPSGYPAYIVRYKASGAYDWSHFMNDVTCVYRKLNIADNNNIYYSGSIHDTLSLDGHAFHHPAWLYDIMIVKMDSTGSVKWTRQLKDTVSGDADAEISDHAAVSADGSLNLMVDARKYVDWGNGVTTNIHGYVSNVSVVNINANGIANWARITNEDFSFGEHITTSPSGIWITGNGSDSSSLQFDSVTVPVPQGKYMPYLAKISVSGTTAIQNTPIPTDAITIAPNPANNIITITGMDINSQVYIRDIQGRLVFEHSYHADKASIDIAAYPRGLYFITVRSADATTVKKLILQ